MKKYEIEINNEVYRVSVRELSADAEMTAAPTVEEPTAADTPSTQGNSGSVKEINAPMAGTIVDIKVSPGQAVSKGDVLVILEAMKMENEIVAPEDGLVGEIFVSRNDAVASDQPLLTL